MASYASSAAGGGTAGSGDRTAAVTPAVDDLLVVFCDVRANTSDTPTCSDDQGGTYTLVEVAHFGADAHRMSAFVRDALVASAVSHTITVATGSNTAGNVVPVAVAGMTKTGATAILQSAKAENQSSGGTPAVTLPAACDTANITLVAVGNGSTPAGVTPPTSWTERQDVGQSTPNTGLEVATRDSGFTGTTITWGSTSGSVFAAIAIELDTSGSGGTTYTLDIGHIASVEAAHGVTTVATAPLALGHAASVEAPHGVTLDAAVAAPLVRPEYTGTPRFVLDATGETILLRGANTILTASDGVSHAAVDNGANAMRLVLNWHVLEPTAPSGSGTDFSTYATSLDATTLSEIDALCQYFADAGAYVLLDFHQASWSPYYSGSGVPDWYYTDSRFTAQQNGGAGWNNSTDKATAIKSWWTDATESPMSQQLYINFVSAFIQWAQGQAWYDHVFGYTTFNELNAGNMTGSSATKVSNMHTWLAPVVSAMNAIEPYRAMFVMCRGGAQGWGTATFSEFGDLASQNICAEFHQYYPGLAPGADADAPVDLTPTYVQEGNSAGHGTTSDFTWDVTVAWPAATTDGSLLLLVITQRNSGGGTAPTTPTVSGWTQVDTDTFSGSGGVGRQTVFKIEAAASRSGSETIDLTPAGAASHTRYYAAQILEYADADTVDIIATATTGTDQSVESPASGALAQGGELALAFVGQLDNNNNAPTTPTGGFAIRRSAGTTSSGSGCYNTVLDQVTPDAASVSTTVALTSADGWVAQLITFTPSAGVAGVGYDSTGDDYYPDSATCHNTTAGSAYVGAEEYQEAFLGVPLAKAASLGIPAFLGEFGVHYDDTGRLDYVADMTVAMDSLALSGCVWKLGVPPGDSLAICSDSAGTLNDVGSAWSTWWLATDFTPGTGVTTLHIGYIPEAGDAFGVDLASALDLPVGHAAAVDQAYGLATPGTLLADLGHVASLETPRGLDLSAVLAQLEIAAIPQRATAVCALGMTNQSLGTVVVSDVEELLGRKFVGLRQNQSITVTSVSVASADFSLGYTVQYRNQETDNAGDWALTATGGFDTDLDSFVANVIAAGHWSPLRPFYLGYHHEQTVDNGTQTGYPTNGTQQDYIDGYRAWALYLDSIGASTWSVDGEWIGGPIQRVWCPWAKMFHSSAPAGETADDFDPNLGTSPAPAGRSYFDFVALDYYNPVISAGTLKYTADPATVLDAVVAKCEAYGKDFLIPEFGCDLSGFTDQPSKDAKAEWVTNVKDYLIARGSAGPGVCRALWLTFSDGGGDYRVDDTAESLAAYQALAQDEYFSAGLDRAYGLSAGVTLSLPIGYIPTASQAFGVGFGAVHVLDVGHISSDEVCYGADLSATLAQLGLGYIPSASAAYGLATPTVTSLLIGRASSPSSLHGLALGAVHQLNVAHIAAAGAAHGVSLVGVLQLSLGHVPASSAGHGLALLIRGIPTMFLVVGCYTGSRTVSPFLPHRAVPLAAAYRVDAALGLHGLVELERDSYEVEL